jgi:AcrR family transcriptional regulator
MSARKLETGIRQEQIALAALELVAGKGLNGLNMAELARQVGLVPSAIYRHYKNKDQVIDAILDLVKARLLDNILAVTAELPDLLDQLQAIMMRHLHLIHQTKGIPDIFFSEEVFQGSAARKAKAYDIIRDYLTKITELVRQGQQTGTVRADIAPDTVAIMFLGMIQSAVILWHLSEGSFDVFRHAENVWKLFSNSLLPPKIGENGK